MTFKYVRPIGLAKRGQDGGEGADPGNEKTIRVQAGVTIRGEFHFGPHMFEGAARRTDISRTVVEDDEAHSHGSPFLEEAERTGATLRAALGED